MASAGTDAWLALLQAAHRYPSPHNSQPIKLRPISATEADVLYDLDLGLPAENYGIPFGHVCAGVFLETLAVAAAAAGYRVEERLAHLEMDFAAAERLHPIARVTLVPRPVEPADSEMFAALEARRTSRRPYDKRVVPEQDLAGVGAIATAGGQVFRVSRDPDVVRDVIRVNQETLFDDLRNDAVHAEILEWLRFSKKEAAERGDGLSAETMLMPGPVLKFAMRRRGLWEAAVIGGLIKRVYLNTMRGVTQIGWLEGPFFGPADYLEAGRTFMKVWLELTRRGIFLHPFGTVITNPRSHAAFVGKAGIAETNRSMAWMLFRFGYSKQPPLAHRRPAEEMIVA